MLIYIPYNLSAEAETEAPPELGDENKVPTEEDMETAGEKRSEAMMAMSEGDLQKAVDLFTEAIKLNPGMISTCIYKYMIELIDRINWSPLFLCCLKVHCWCIQ